MTLRTQYLLLIIFLHISPLVLTYILFQENKIFFILSEMIILLSLFFSIQLHQSLVKPLKLILTGIEAIKDQDFNIKFLKTGKQEMDQLIEVYNQMIDKLREERRLQEEQHYFLDKLILNSPTAILVLDFDGKIERINPRATEILNFEAEEMEGKRLIDIDHPITQRVLDVKLNHSEIIAINGVHSFKCHRSQFVDRGFYRQFIMIEELTEEILRTEKNAYGKVIRMMAHEVNNSIGPINAILEALLFYQNQLKEDQREDFEEVIKIAQGRNGRLNQFMKNFANVVRLPEPHREEKDLKQVIQSAVQFLELEATKRNIKIVFELPEKPVKYHFDIFQLEQVLLNIIKNAIEAIDHEEGEIHIQLTKKPVGIIIKNNGVPIKDADRHKLFSPFFSTKKEGQGIGLTLTREILHNHGFSFALTTKKDGWTYFEIQMRPANVF